MRRRARIAKIPLDRNTMTSLTNALGDVAKGRYAPSIIRKERIRICNSCPYGGNRCDLCGCFIKTKTVLLSSSCPIGKWSKPFRDTSVHSGKEQDTAE